MSDVNAFVTPEYPVLFSVQEESVFKGSLPPGQAAVSLAILVRGIPSFLATHVVSEEELPEVRESLEAGDVRVAVVGLKVAVDVEGEGVVPGHEKTERPAAFVSLICADSRRLTLARIVGRGSGHTPEELARYVIKEIARGVQVPDLAAAR